VSYFDPRVDPQTRTAKVRVEVPNPDGRLRLGMYWHDGRLAGGYGCPGMAMMGPGMGMMGSGMMGGPGWAPPQTPRTDEKAKELAQQADTYLKGFSVERVLP
jgi:hypothetical protein